MLGHIRHDSRYSYKHIMSLPGLARSADLAPTENIWNMIKRRHRLRIPPN